MLSMYKQKSCVGHFAIRWWILDILSEIEFQCWESLLGKSFPGEVSLNIEFHLCRLVFELS